MNPERLIAVITLVSLTLGAGLEVDREHLKAVLRNVGLLGRALLANFIIVPILGILLAKALRLPAPVATGVLLMAIAPGVPFVLTSVRKRGGSLGLAVALAFFLPLISIATVPATAALVLPTAAKAELPMARFVLTLVLFQLLPLLAGIVTSALAPSVSGRLARPLQLAFFASILALVVLMAPTIGRSIASVYGSNGMWAMLLLVLFSLAVGWALGGPAREDRRVLALGTALRNIGLCALVATSSFATPLVAATVLTYFVIQFVITTIVGIYFTRTAKEAIA
jgi:bile acid:Na+ symporter, BASS family